MSYYSEGHTFTNRLQAIKHNQQTQQPIYFHYHDEIWSKLDWRVEPEGSIDFHYKMQAQRIRDEYDYIILCYSGGYDSSNILEVFHYNNIKLDKIVVTGPFKQDSHSGVDENHNGEIYKNAFPHLSTMGLDSIVHVVDYTDLYGDMNNFSVYSLGENWVDDIGGKYSPHHFFWVDLPKHVIPKNQQDKKVAIIWGTDKPFMHFRDGKQGFAFGDTYVNSYSRYAQNKTSNIKNVNFYWDEDYPLILLKQLHILKNNNLTRAVQNLDLIYNFKHPLVYKSGKSPHPTLGVRDRFLLNHKNSDLYKFYQLGMARLQREVGIESLGPIFSKFYAIE